MLQANDECHDYRDEKQTEKLSAECECRVGLTCPFINYWSHGYLFFPSFQRKAVHSFKTTLIFVNVGIFYHLLRLQQDEHCQMVPHFQLLFSLLWVQGVSKRSQRCNSTCANCVPMNTISREYLLSHVFTTIWQIFRGGAHGFQSNQPKTR